MAEILVGLEKRPSLAWVGIWSRTKDYFSPATLKIWNVDDTGFDFKLSATSGANMGMIGFFSEGPQRAQLTGGTAVYENKGGKLTFYLQENKLMIKEEGNLGAGMGVGYSGEYQKGKAVLLPPTLTEHKVFSNSAEEEVFKTLVSDQYDTFLISFHLVSEEKDLDQIGATVYSGGVRGLFTYMEGIIMRTPDGEMWAAITGPDKVRYFTNSKRINGLPLTIDNWRSRFKTREVIMVYKP
jgi:hypothetical protein